MTEAERTEQLKRKYSWKPAPAPKRRHNRKANLAPGKPSSGGQTIRRLLSYLEEDRRKLILAFFCVIVNTVGSLGGAYMLRPIINTYIVPADGRRGC